MTVPTTREMDDVVDRMLDLNRAAGSGDEASQLRQAGIARWMARDLDAAVRLLEQAARLGDAAAMKDAGDCARELGRASEAQYWVEGAAHAGNPAAMYNVGALSIQDGSRTEAAAWFQKAAEAGDPAGYAALTQIAGDAGDEPGERRWAHLGAEAGNDFCLYRHGLYLTMSANGDRPVLREACVHLEESGRRGNCDGMLLAGEVCSQLGDEAAARTWYERARATADPKALAMLDKPGLRSDGSAEKLCRGRPMPLLGGAPRHDSNLRTQLRTRRRRRNRRVPDTISSELGCR